MSDKPRARYALTTEQKSDAREALRLLEGTDLTLTKAVHKALAGRHAVSRTTLAVVADKFVLNLVRTGARGATVRWYENKLVPMLDAFGDRMIDDITRVEIKEAGQGYDVEDSTRASYYRALRAVFRWAMEQDPPMLGVDVTIGLPTTAKRDEEKHTGILTVEESAAVLAGAGQHRSALALMLFAGLRPDELWGKDKPPLLWKHILIDEKIIRVPAEIAKTRKARTLEELPDTVWSWLQPRRPEDQVSNSSSQWLTRVAQLAAGFSVKEGGQMKVVRPWPYDGTRHSFGTYALALTKDPGKVSLWLGHEGDPKLLYTAYRGLTTKPLAEKYFAQRPAA